MNTNILRVIINNNYYCNFNRYMIFITMNLQEQISRIQSMMKVITENKNVKDILFKYWDNNGFQNIESSNDVYGLTEKEYFNYVKEYMGDDYKNIIEKEVNDIVNKIKECDGDEFSVNVNYIDFIDEDLYTVNLAVNLESPVFDEINMGDFEEVLTVFGQIERCVEDILNEKLYDKYGKYAKQVMVNI